MLYQRYFNPILQWVVASLQTMKNTYGGIFIFNKVIKNDTSPKLFLIFCLEANSGKSQNAPLHILILNKVVNAGFTTCMFVLCIHLAKKHFFPVDKKIFLCIVTHLHATFSGLDPRIRRTGINGFQGALTLHFPLLTVPSFDSESMKPLGV